MKDDYALILVSSVSYTIGYYNCNVVLVNYRTAITFCPIKIMDRNPLWLYLLGILSQGADLNAVQKTISELLVVSNFWIQPYKEAIFVS